MNRESVWYRRTSCSIPGLLLFVLCGLSITLSTGCGSTKSLPTTIAFASGQMAPPSSAVATSTVQFAAIVNDDSANLGVSWLLTCGSPTVAGCGSLSRHTASGAPATFIAPASVPPGGIVTVQANSSAVPAASLTVTITITPIVYGPVSIAFSPPLPPTIPIGTNPSIVAVVTNDHLGQNGQPMGCTMSPPVCSVAGTCGFLTTLNSCVAIYIPPSQVPQGGTVTFTATSNADPTQTATATETITPPTVAISLSPPPPASISAGAATNVAAMVTNGTDPDPLGVDWSVTCASPACGSFIPQHTANAVVTSYTAPSLVPPGGTITVTATSTSDPTKQASATLTVTPATLNNGLLKGQYAFLLSGVQVEGTSVLAGSVIADGNGNITAGEESILGQPSPVNGITGSYFIGADGRGTMTLSGLPGFGYGGWLNGQQIFAITAVDPSHVFVEEFDGSGPYNIRGNPVIAPWYGRTLRGELELQQASDFGVSPTGVYAFTMTHGGPTFSQASCSLFFVCAAYYGGVLTADSVGNITNFWMDRYVDGVTGSIVSGGYGPQSFGALDSFGYGNVNLGPYSFAYFVVDSGHLIVMASSSADNTGLPAGHLYSQSSAAASLAGTYVFTFAGSTPLTSVNGQNAIGSSPEAIGAWFTSDQNGNVTGYLDTNNSGTVQSSPVSGTLVPSIVSGNAVAGRWTLTLVGGGASQFAVYPTVDRGLLMFQLDTRKSGTGTALVQALSSLTLQGTYAMSVQQLGTLNLARNQTLGLPIGAWSDISGQIIASSSSNLTGILDIDQVNGLFLGPSGNFWTQAPSASTTGNFTTGAQGRFTGSITLPATTSIQPGTLGAVFYVVDDSTVMLLENDATPGVGMLWVQNF